MDPTLGAPRQGGGTAGPKLVGFREEGQVQATGVGCGVSGQGALGSGPGVCVALGCQTVWARGFPLSLLSVSRPRRCQAGLGSIFPLRATAGAVGRKAEFEGGPPVAGACWKTGR